MWWRWEENIRDTALRIKLRINARAILPL
jgi:hypothetical protein